MQQAFIRIGSFVISLIHLFSEKNFNQYEILP